MDAKRLPSQNLDLGDESGVAVAITREKVIPRLARKPASVVEELLGAR